MCLIVFAWRVIPGTPLIAVGNRDEFYKRPAAPAGWWADFPKVYAGRDLQGNGTWIGITRDGRFSAVTTVRDGAPKHADAPSRGMLAADFLTGHATPEEYITGIAKEAGRYNGFNLLVGTGAELTWFSNRSAADARNGKPLPSGVYGLSNDGLDSCWPKVVKAKAEFSSLLCQGATLDAFFEMLTDTTRAADSRLPSTGSDLETERMLSAVCVESPDYGTRTSTFVQLDDAGMALLHERSVK